MQSVQILFLESYQNVSNINNVEREIYLPFNPTKNKISQMPTDIYCSKKINRREDFASVLCHLIKITVESVLTIKIYCELSKQKDSLYHYNQYFNDRIIVVASRIPKMSTYSCSHCEHCKHCLLNFIEFATNKRNKCLSTMSVILSIIKKMKIFLFDFQV